MPKLLLFLFVVLFFSCVKDPINPESISKGYEYYPLETGSFLIYDVSKKEKVANGFSYSNYQVKEVVSDTFTEGEEKSYRLEKYIRSSANESWPLSPDSVFSVRLQDDKIILTEDNQRFVKLVFPVKKGKVWDGNVYNSYKEDEYYFETLNVPFLAGDQSFTSTLTIVQQADTNNRVYRNLRYEVYAKDIGLVYKRTENLNFDFNSGDTTSGVIYSKLLIEKGQ